MTNVNMFFFNINRMINDVQYNDFVCLDEDEFSYVGANRWSNDSSKRCLMLSIRQTGGVENTRAYLAADVRERRRRLSTQASRRLDVDWGAMPAPRACPPPLVARCACPPPPPPPPPPCPPPPPPALFALPTPSERACDLRHHHPQWWWWQRWWWRPRNGQHGYCCGKG